jgi:hypothetical protein
MYIPRQSFTVHLPHRDMAFYHREKIYVAGWYDTEEHNTNTILDSKGDIGAYVTTVYTKAEDFGQREPMSSYELVVTHPLWRLYTLWKTVT